MTEYQYLEALDLALLTLSQGERQRLLDDYRRYFREGRAAGKSEEEVALQLGDPQEAAKKYLAEREEYYRYPYHPKAAPRRRWLQVAAFAGLVVMCTGFMINRAQPRHENIPMDYAVSYVEKPAVTEILPDLDKEYFAELFEKAGPMAEEFVATVMDGIQQYTHDLVFFDTAQGFEGVSKIEVAGNYRLGVTILGDERQDVGLEVYGEIPQAHDITIDCANGKLEIEYKSHGIFLDAVTNIPAQVTIYVPLSWMGEVNVVTVSGDVTVCEPSAISSLSVATASGGIDIRQRASITSLEIATASGDVFLETSAQKLKVAGVSGDVSLLLFDTPGHAEIATVSGDIFVTVPDDCGYQISTLSGDVINQGNLPHGSNVNIATVSGDVFLEAL